MTFDSFEHFAAALLDAITSSNWTLAVALVLVFAVWLIRRFGARYLPLLNTDAGGVILVFATSLTGTVATALASGAPFTWDLVLDAVKLAWMAAGGFTMLKKLLGPLVMRLVPILLRSY